MVKGKNTYGIKKVRFSYAQVEMLPVCSLAELFYTCRRVVRTATCLLVNFVYFSCLKATANCVIHSSCRTNLGDVSCFFLCGNSLAELLKFCTVSDCRVVSFRRNLSHSG